MSGKPATFSLKLEISWHMTRYLKENTHRDFNSRSTDYAVDEPINDNMFGGKMSLLPLLNAISCTLHADMSTLSK